MTVQTAFSYDQWVTEQAERIETALRDYARKGQTSGLSAWVVPSSHVEPGQPGYLHIGTEAPFFGADIVRLMPNGPSPSRLAYCAYPDLRSLLWHAAKSYPILPIPAV